MRFIFAAAIALAVAASAPAENKCLAKGVMGGKPFSMTHCAVSYYDDQHSVTIWIAEAPITPEEARRFETSAYPPDKDSSGKTRTMLHLGFCPGGGTAVPKPNAPRSVEFWMADADSFLLSRQWVIEPKDKDWKFEKLSGKLEPSGKLSGRMTGSRTSEGKYAWEIDFDLTLPAKTALAGMGCGS